MACYGDMMADPVLAESQRMIDQAFAEQRELDSDQAAFYDGGVDDSVSEVGWHEPGQPGSDNYYNNSINTEQLGYSPHSQHYPQYPIHCAPFHAHPPPFARTGAHPTQLPPPPRPSQPQQRPRPQPAPISTPPHQTAHQPVLLQKHSKLNAPSSHPPNPVRQPRQPLQPEPEPRPQLHPPHQQPLQPAAFQFARQPSAAQQPITGHAQAQAHPSGGPVATEAYEAGQAPRKAFRLNTQVPQLVAQPSGQRAGWPAWQGGGHFAARPQPAPSQAQVSIEASQPEQPNRSPAVFRPAGGRASGKVGGPQPARDDAQSGGGPAGASGKVEEEDYDTVDDADGDFLAQAADRADLYNVTEGGSRQAALRKPAYHGTGRIALKPTSAVESDMFRSLFPFNVFNRIQSDTFDVAFHSKDNLVVSAPTGGGKTVIFELAILAELRDSSVNKVIYVCPTRSLCNERVADWKRRFPAVGMNVIEYTGEAASKNTTEKAEIADLARARLIVTTPEKMDQLTRRDDNHRHISNTGLVCLDEIHSVSSDVRGPVLEVLVSRMRKITKARFVCVSATIPNSDDVARWIGNRDDPHGSAQLFNFGEETRPCKLERFVVGVNKSTGQNDFSFGSSLNYKLYDLISKYSDGKPCLVFVNSRKACPQAAEHIRKQYAEAAAGIATEPLPWDLPTSAPVADDKVLTNLLKYGIGVHHAGLNFNDRHLVEHGFINGLISVVVCTTTLAVGVNLPARLVIVRGTTNWNNGRAAAYSDLDLLQILGRAGRPRYDTKGVGVIICAKDDERYYDNLINSKTLLESKLHKSLVEHLNSEITLRTITDMDDALAWVGGTFLSVRFAKNKHYYRQIADDDRTAVSIGKAHEITLENFISHACTALSEAGIIRVDGDGRLFPTDLGEIMSRWGISFASFKKVCTLPRLANMRDVLECVAGSEEASQFRWRGGEKTVYKKVLPKLPYPPSKLHTTQEKVSVLLQTALGGLPIGELKADASNPSMELMTLWPIAARTAKAIADVQLDRRDGGCKSGLDLVRALQARTWEGSASVLRQIKGIGEKAYQILDAAGISSLEEFSKQDYHRIQMLITPGVIQAKRMITEAKGFPRFGVQVRIEKEEITKEGVKVHGAVEVELKNLSTVRLDKEVRWHCSLLTLKNDNEYIDYRRIPVKSLKKDGGVQRFVFITTLHYASNFVVTTAACEEVAGTSIRATAVPRTDHMDWPVVIQNPTEDVEMNDFELDADAEAQLDAIEQAAEARPMTLAREVKPRPAPVAPIKGVTQTEAKARARARASVAEAAATAAALVVAPPKTSSSAFRSPVQTPASTFAPRATALAAVPTVTPSQALPPRLLDPAESDDELVEPVQLPNGKWKCKHACKKPCKHTCCQKGLDKPPKPKTKPKGAAQPVAVEVNAPSPPLSNPTADQLAQMARMLAEAGMVVTNAPVGSIRRVGSMSASRGWGTAAVVELSEGDDDDLPPAESLLAPEAVARGKQKALEKKRAKVREKLTLPKDGQDIPYKELLRRVRKRPALINDLPAENKAHLIAELGLSQIPSYAHESETIELSDEDDDNPVAALMAARPEAFSSEDEVQVQPAAKPAGPLKASNVTVPEASAIAGPSSTAVAGVKRSRSPLKEWDLDSLYDSEEEPGQERPPAKIAKLTAPDPAPDSVDEPRHTLPPRLELGKDLFTNVGRVDDDEINEPDELDVEGPNGLALAPSATASSLPPVASTTAIDQARELEAGKDQGQDKKETELSTLDKADQLDADGTIDWSWLDAQAETDEEEMARLSREAKEKEEMRRDKWEMDKLAKVAKGEEKARREAIELEQELRGAGEGATGAVVEEQGQEQEVNEVDQMADLEAWLKANGMFEGD